MIYNTIVMITGVGIYGYVIGNITRVISNMDLAESQFVDNMDKLNSFMRYHSLPIELQDRVHNYHKYMWGSHVGISEEEILSGLSPALKTEIAMFLHKELLEKVPIFKGASEDMIREIVQNIKSVVYSPGDYVFKAGDLGQEMYFISKGDVEIVAKNSDTVLVTLRAGSFFGETALLMNQPRNASARAGGYCDLYRLDKEAFDQVIKKHPDFASHIEEKVKEIYAKN